MALDLCFKVALIFLSLVFGEIFYVFSACCSFSLNQMAMFVMSALSHSVVIEFLLSILSVKVSLV